MPAADIGSELLQFAIPSFGNLSSIGKAGSQMGFDHNALKFVLYCQKLGVDFSSVATLGRQGLHLTRAELKKVLSKAGFAPAAADQIYSPYVEPFLKYLGAQLVHSFDASTYEGATFIHDMNKPIDELEHRKYSTVIDSGTLEHIFNVPTCLANSMALTTLGGHFICMVPANNMLGHGFYQFCPELFYRALDTKYGFKIKKLFLYEADWRNYWIESPDPATVGQRLPLVNCRQTGLLMVAQKIADNVGTFSEIGWPQQAEYQQIEWKRKKATDRKDQNPAKSFLRDLKPHLPVFALDTAAKLAGLAMLRHRKKYSRFRPF